MFAGDGSQGGGSESVSRRRSANNAMNNLHLNGNSVGVPFPVRPSLEAIESAPKTFDGVSSFPQQPRTTLGFVVSDLLG
jgi:hypothetical protein